MAWPGYFSTGTKLSPLSSSPDNTIRPTQVLKPETGANDCSDLPLTELQIADQQDEHRRICLEQQR